MEIELMSESVALETVPSDAVLGAEIGGVNASAPLAPDVFQTIDDALKERIVVCLPGQWLSPGQLVTFGQQFGELEPHVLSQYHHPDHPEVLVLSNVVENGKALGFRDAGSYWHSDLSYKDKPTKYTILHAREVPDVGGDTLFVSGYAVYEALPNSLRTRVSGMRAIHSYAFRHEQMIAKNKLRAPLTSEQKRAVPDVSHPAVRTHPDTGRKALYINPGFTKAFDGLAPAESKALLDDLYSIALRPEFSYRHNWRKGDVLIWDNRCSMHLADGGYGEDQRRLMHRVTVRGTAPV